MTTELTNELGEAMKAIVGNQIFTRSIQHREIYVNGSRFGVSPWDLRIVYSTAGGEGIAGEDQVTVIMSPQHALVAMNAWKKAIEAYEKLFGTIPDLEPKLEAARATLPTSKPAITPETPRKKRVSVKKAAAKVKA